MKGRRSGHPRRVERRRVWTGLVFAAAFAYSAVPYLVVQVANLGLIREGRRRKREVALTFDDGPDPATTPQLLDALKAAGARATFFVLADQAEQHPDLLRRISAEGHQVAAHAHWHRNARLISPWSAYLDPVRAVRRIARVLGQPVCLYRPPHGAYTLTTLLGMRAAGVTGVHWSIESQDWNRRYRPEEVRERLNRLLVPGAVIVLHDAGPGAETTVPLLPDFLADLKRRGYTSVTLRELEGATPQDLPFVRRRLFSLLDSLFDRAGQIRFSGDRADNLFRVGPMKFPLQGVRLADGSPVAWGVPAAEFHVNNALIVDIGPRRAVRQGPADFGAMVRDLETRPELRQAEVIYCLSSLAPLLALVGFETHELPASDQKRLHGWANVLRRAYGTRKEAQTPRLSILSRERFIELFAPAGHSR